MAIGRTTWTDDDGSGTTGTVINNAQLQAIYDAIDAYITNGTFTPTIVGATSGEATYTTRSAVYWKVGKKVFFQIYFNIATGGTIVGAPRIAGLPFTSATATNFGAITFGYFSGLGSSVVSLLGHVASNATYITLYKLTAAAAAPSAFVAGDVAAGEWIVSGQYITA